MGRLPILLVGLMAAAAFPVGVQAGDDLVIPGFSTGMTVQSYLRLSNSDGVAHSIRVRLHDAATGTALGTWTSPSLPPGGTLETFAQAMLAQTDPPVNMAAVPLELVLSITGLVGHVQHAAWIPGTGTWSHVSTCGMVLMADPLSLPFVVGPARAGLAGLVRLTNGTGEARSLRVTFHDSAGAAFIWQSPVAPSYGAVTTSMSAIAAQTTPPIPETAVSLMAMADPAPAGVALSYSEGLAGGTTFDDFSAGCMATVAAAPGDPAFTPPTPAPGGGHVMN